MRYGSSRVSSGLMALLQGMAFAVTLEGKAEPRDLWPDREGSPAASRVNDTERAQEGFRRAAELARAGSWEEAVEAGEVASLDRTSGLPSDLSSDLGSDLVSPLWWRINLAEALMAVGKLPEAWARAGEAVSLARVLRPRERAPVPSLLLALYEATSIAYRVGEPAAAWAYLDEAALLDPRGALLHAWTLGERDVAILPRGDGLFIEALRAFHERTWQEATSALMAWRRALPNSRYGSTGDKLAAEIAAAGAGSQGRLPPDSTGDGLPRPSQDGVQASSQEKMPDHPAHLDALSTLAAHGVVAPRLDAALRTLRPALESCANQIDEDEVRALRERGEHLEVRLFFGTEGRISSVELVPAAPAPWVALASCWQVSLSSLTLGRLPKGAWARLRVSFR